MIPFNQSFTALSLFISRIYDIEFVNDPKDPSKSKKIVVRVVDDYNVPSSVTHSKRLRDAKKLKAIKAIKSKSVTNSTKTPAVDDGDDEEEEEEEEEDEDIDIVLDDNHHRRAIPKPIVTEPDKEDEDGDQEMDGDLEIDLESKYNVEDTDLSVTLEKAVDLADKKMVKMTWKSSPISDMIADSIIGLALTLEVDPSTAIAEVMMQPVDHDELNQHRQSQPHPLSSNLSSMMSSKEAFAFILCEQFGNENVQCIEENMPFRDTVQGGGEGDGVKKQMAADQMMAISHHIFVVPECFVVHYEGSTATISFKYNYKRRYDTKLHQRTYFSARKERLESNLKKKKKSKIQKQLRDFESMLERIAENEEEYFDQQFIPCFEVQSEDQVLKQRIESILHCVDNALYPITCDFDCIDSFESVFDHGHSVEDEQKTKAIEPPQKNEENERKEVTDDLMRGNEGNDDDRKVDG